MPGYKQPCRFCDKLVSEDANACPFCGKKNPMGARCPMCRNPTQSDWKACGGCGFSLVIKCPGCGKDTFFDDYCSSCGKELTMACRNCGREQPISAKCIGCGKKM